MLGPTNVLVVNVALGFFARILDQFFVCPLSPISKRRGLLDDSTLGPSVAGEFGRNRVNSPRRVWSQGDMALRPINHAGGLFWCFPYLGCDWRGGGAVPGGSPLLVGKTIDYIYNRWLR